MRKNIFLASLLMLCINFWSCSFDTITVPKELEPMSFSISGTIIDKQTNSPLDSIHVELINNRYYNDLYGARSTESEAIEHTLSADNGRFKIVVDNFDERSSFFSIRVNYKGNNYKVPYYLPEEVDVNPDSDTKVGLQAESKINIDFDDIPSYNPDFYRFIKVNIIKTNTNDIFQQANLDLGEPMMFKVHTGERKVEIRSYFNRDSLTDAFSLDTLINFEPLKDYSFTIPH